MERNITKILHDIADVAVDAAAGAKTVAKTAMTNAKDALGDKYDVMKLNFENGKLKGEQEAVFQEIGKILFCMHTGKLQQNSQTFAQGKTPQQMIDTLLLMAEQLQQQIDALQDRKKGYTLKTDVVCPVCGKECAKEDLYCAGCGLQLQQKKEMLP